MPLRKSNTRSFHRKLYAGELQKVTLLKRYNDQREGGVVAYVLFNCRRERIFKAGQPMQGEMAIDERTVWQIPSEELRRVGVNYINVLDRVVDEFNRFWQPETRQSIANRLFENFVFIDCVRVDPPSPPAKPAITGV